MRGRFILKTLVVILSFLHTVSSRAVDRGSVITEISGLLNKGDSLLYADKIDLARKYYQAARKVSRENSQKYYKAFAEYKHGFSYLIENDEKQAKGVFGKLLSDFTPLNTRDSAFYRLVQAEKKSLDLTHLLRDSEIKAFFTEIENFSDQYTAWELTRVNYLLAKMFYNQGDYHQSIWYCKKNKRQACFAPYTKQRTVFLQIKACNEIREYQIVIDIGLILLGDCSLYVSNVELHKKVGHAYLITGRYQEALRHFALLLQVAIRENDLNLQVNTTVSIAHCYLLQNKHSKALEYYELAYRTARGKSVGARTKILTTQCMIYYYKEAGQIEPQAKYIDELIELIDIGVPLIHELEILRSIALYYSRKGDHEKVIAIVNEFLNEYKEYNLELYGDYSGMITSKYLAYYRLWEKDSSNLDNLRRSYTGFRHIVEIKRRSLNRLSAKNSKISFLTKLRMPYINAFISGVNLFANENDSSLLPELYEYVEGAKGIVFKQELQNTHAIQYAGIPNELILMEGELRSRISGLRKERRTLEVDDINRQHIKELSLATDQYDSIMSVFEMKYPDYFSLKFKSKASQLDETQHKLSEDQALINYYMAEGRLFAFLLTAKEVVFKEIEIDSSFVRNVLDYRKCVQSAQIYEESDFGLDEFVNLSYRLYVTVIKPFEDKIGGKRLVLVPYAELNFIPFETLVTDTNYEVMNGYGGLNYLIKTNPVSILYSSEQMKRKKGNLSKRCRFLGFAPEYVARQEGYDFLAGAKSEVEAISKYFSGDSYFGKEANKKKFMEEGPHRDIVHLAMHTELNDEDPMFSKLLFGSQEDSGVAPLFINEVFGHHFKTKLLVLSGCESGYGRLLGNEGVMSLARTFFYCGIENVVVTQWAIADESSSLLMNGFYQHLSNENNSVDVALQQAKLDYLKKSDPMRHHPYFWSGYMVVGDPVYGHRSGIVYILLLCGILAIFVLVALLRKLSKKNRE